MASDTVTDLLNTLVSDDACRRQFLSDREGYLAGLALAPEQRAALLTLNLESLVEKADYRRGPAGIANPAPVGGAARGIGAPEPGAAIGIGAPGAR
jgi:hypothetical protein